MSFVLVVGCCFMLPDIYIFDVFDHFRASGGQAGPVLSDHFPTKAARDLRFRIAVKLGRGALDEH